ncbi:unnamed protein product [Haemonchus placei]|uniref:Protein kinase domain-containing protein n=1 Tax=Haemonchus placei TaxID=6290 RepID=A0A158QR39_HAEPC|nr:unnamed protein product [Haemonchus placei]
MNWVPVIDYHLYVASSSLLHTMITFYPKEPKPSPLNEIERLQALLRAKDDHLDKLKTKQSLAQLSSKCVSDFEQEFDKQDWRNMFNSSADYVFSIEERLRQLANRNGQFRSWAEFQTLSNKLELFLRVAQQHHRVMKKAIDEYGREMLKILQTLDVMIFADTNNENVMVFAPDQILKDVAAAGGGNSTGAASSKIAFGSDISVKGSVTPQNGLAVPPLGFCATSLSAETETIRTANIPPPPVAPATDVFTPPTETPSIPFCGNGPTMPLLTPPATPENFVAARNVLLPAHFDMRLPLYARVWSAASALSNFLHIPLPPCTPNELNAVSLPANTTTAGESLLPPAQSRKHGMLPPFTPPESQLLLNLKTPSIKGRRSSRLLKKLAPAAGQGSNTTVSAAETTNKEMADTVNVLVGKPLTMSSTMNAEPANADVLPPVVDSDPDCVLSRVISGCEGWTTSTKNIMKHASLHSPMDSLTMHFVNTENFGEDMVANWAEFFEARQGLFRGIANTNIGNRPETIELMPSSWRPTKFPSEPLCHLYVYESNPGEEGFKEHGCVWDYLEQISMFRSRQQSAATYPPDRRPDRGSGMGSALYKAAVLHFPSICSGAILQNDTRSTAANSNL